MGSTGHVITTVISGYISNRISYSTPSLIIGKIMSIFGSLCFLSIELLKTQLRVVLPVMTLLYGLSMGLMSVMRAQVSWRKKFGGSHFLKTKQVIFRTRAFSGLILVVRSRQTPSRLFSELVHDLRYCCRAV